MTMNFMHIFGTSYPEVTKCGGWRSFYDYQFHFPCALRDMVTNEKKRNRRWQMGIISHDVEKLTGSKSL